MVGNSCTKPTFKLVWSDFSFAFDNVFYLFPPFSLFVKFSSHFTSFIYLALFLQFYHFSLHLTRFFFIFYFFFHWFSLNFSKLLELIHFNLKIIWFFFFSEIIFQGVNIDPRGGKTRLHLKLLAQWCFYGVWMGNRWKAPWQKPPGEKLG